MSKHRLELAIGGGLLAVGVTLAGTVVFIADSMFVLGLFLGNAIASIGGLVLGRAIKALAGREGEDRLVDR
jgi:hypothetical protein